MDPETFLRGAVTEKRIESFARWKDEECFGRGRGLIIDRDDRIAVLLEDCGFPSCTHDGLAAGAIVHYCVFEDAPSDRFRILDTPAYVENHARNERPKDWPPR